MKFHEYYKGLAHSALNIPMRDDDAREVEKLLDTGEYSPIKKHSVILESFSPNERSDISVITDNSVDTDREIIVPKGVDFSRFQKNPIVTFGHNWYAPPIAKSLWQKLVGGTTWKAKTQYVSRPETLDKSQNWLPDTIWHLVKEGFLPGKSIGGLGKSREITAKDIEENPSWSKAKTVVDELRVYEYSVVSIQANQNAIVEAVAKGLIGFPDEILQKDFPEIHEMLKEVKVIPEIKMFKTIQDYRQEVFDRFALKCQELPTLVDDVVSGVLGRV